jgi:hypothetical protein
LKKESQQLALPILEQEIYNNLIEGDGVPQKRLALMTPDDVFSVTGVFVVVPDFSRRIKLKGSDDESSMDGIHR